MQAEVAAGTAPPVPQAPAAECSDVVKIYWTATGEVNALKGVDVVFPAASVTAVVGPSGSGKSSLLRILAGLDRPTAGQVRIAGREISGLRPPALRRIRRSMLGYVFQRPAENLIPYLSVAEHLRLAARFRRADGDGGAGELLEMLGISHRIRHRPRQLSGGEQQRLAFAQAVVGGPALVVADEPTAELDTASGRALLEAVTTLARRGTSFVVATHDPAVMRLADGTYHLHHGALHTESREGRGLAVIDGAGRVQLPAEALRLFPDRRAEITVDDGEVRITPP